MRKLFVFLNLPPALCLVFAAAAPLISPEFISWPAFLGMGFLPLFVLNVLLALIWILWKPWYASISGIALIIALGGFSKHIHMALDQGAPQENDLKVMSYNTRLFDLYNWNSNKVTRDSILTFLKREDVDILCIQEYFRSNNNAYFNTQDTMVSLLRAKHVHADYSMIIHKGRHQFGIATFSSLPIVERGRVSIPNSGHNMCIYTDLKAGEDTLRVFNFHLASIRISGMEAAIEKQIDSSDTDSKFAMAKELHGMFDRAYRHRARQADKIRDAIEQSPYPVLVCGDLNDTPGSYAYHEISHGLQDPFMNYGRGAGSTYIGFFPSFRIDYMLGSEAVNFTSYRTHDVHLSDHRPITASFHLTSE